MSGAGGLWDPSTAYLLDRLALVEARVRAVVAWRRVDDPDPDDRFRGLYITDAQVDDLLGAGRGREEAPPPDAEAARLAEAVEVRAEAEELAGADLRLRRLARSFALDGLDVELLLIALAPDLDTRFERLYAYLNDDVSRRRATVGLALELCGAARPRGEERRRLGATGPLVRSGLLLVEEPDRPFLSRSLRVPDRVTAHLLGDDTPAPATQALRVDGAVADLDGVDALVRTLRQGTRLCYIREATGAAGLSLAATALTRAGLPPVAVDLRRLEATDTWRRSPAW